MTVAEGNPISEAGQTGRWHPAAAFLAVIGVVLIASVAGFVAMAALFGRGAGGAPVDIAAPLPAVAGLLATQLVMIVGALVLGRLRGAEPRRILALGPPTGGVAAYVMAIGVTVLVLGIYNVVVIFGLGHDFWADLRPFAGLVRHDAWLLALLAIGLGAPLSEEFLFRGFLQSTLTPSRLGFAGAAIISTLIWAALHWGYSIVGMIEVVLIGLVFAWLVRRYGSIRPGLFVHAVYNSALTLLLKFGPVPF